MDVGQNSSTQSPLVLFGATCLVVLFILKTRLGAATLVSWHAQPHVYFIVLDGTWWMVWKVVNCCYVRYLRGNPNTLDADPRPERF